LPLESENAMRSENKKGSLLKKLPSLWFAVLSVLGFCLQPSPLEAQPPEERLSLLRRLYADSVLAVNVIIQKDDGTTYEKKGTTFIVDPSGFALTAAHVLGPPRAKRAITVRARDRINGKSWSAEAIKIDEDLDIALIKLPDPQLAGQSWIPLQIGDSAGLSAELESRIDVLAFNNISPGLETYSGRISTAELQNGWFSLKGDPLEPTNSGAPAFNLSVQVVGFVVGGRPESPGSPPRASYISPINFARGILAIAGIR
jgi:S1-C subfamily serine protease